MHRLVPGKKTPVTGSAVIPIGKEFVLLKADCPPAAFPVPTMERIVTGKCRKAGGHSDALGCASSDSISTLPPLTASPGES